MANVESNTSRKLIITGIIVVIVVAGLLLPMWRMSLKGGKASEDIACIAAKAVYSNNTRSFQRLFSSDTKDKSGFVQQVSQRVQKYGPIKEVVLMSNDRMLPGLDGKGAYGGPCPGQSSWKIVAERGQYMIAIHVKDGNLVGCNFNLPGGESIITGAW